eukprot:COSAG01_NODE_20142_length_967_cov_167.849252_1_plen_94_part_00
MLDLARSRNSYWILGSYPVRSAVRENCSWFTEPRRGRSIWPMIESSAAACAYSRTRGMRETAGERDIMSGAAAGLAVGPPTVHSMTRSAELGA